MPTQGFGSRYADLSLELRQLPPSLFNANRIGIMLEIYSAGGVDFVQLKRDMELSDGALATHLKYLTNDGLISGKKEQVGSRQRTAYLITQKGVQAIERFLADFKRVSNEITN